ncbi:MAG: hypothetical protein IKR25_01085 [Muribaculaceae bacterium]|nr:hypothetical protein [Muribaculaceae bacterium]
MRHKDRILCVLLAFSVWQILAVKLEWRHLSLPIAVSDSLNEVLTALALAYICTYVFYFISIRLPFKVKQEPQLEAFKKRIEHLAEEMRTIVGIVQNNPICLDCDKKHFEKLIQELVKVSMEKKVSFTLSEKEKAITLTSFTAIKLLLSKIRQTCFETLCVYHDYLDLERIGALQEILDSDFYILMESWNENIEENDRIHLCNELQHLYRLLLSAKDGSYHVNSVCCQNY